MGKFRCAGLLIALLAFGFGASRPAAESGDFRFSILGDRTGGAVPGVYESAWREVDTLHPDFVINVGDTIEGGNDARVESEWQAVRAVFGRYPYRLYFTPGNHDIWSEASRREWKRQTGRPAFYSFDYGQAHFTVLDNSRTQELGKEQLEFLEADLKANQQRSPKFVFFHKPFWIMYLVLGSGEFPLHRLARKYGVTHVFSGHVHQFLRRERDGVGYTVVGSSGAALGHGDYRGSEFKDGWFYHHLLVTVREGRVQVTVKELGPPHGKGRTLDLRQWGAGAATPSESVQTP